MAINGQAQHWAGSVPYSRLRSLVATFGPQKSLMSMHEVAMVREEGSNEMCDGRLDLMVALQLVEEGSTTRKTRLGRERHQA